MNTIFSIIQILVPIIATLLLGYGLVRKKVGYVSSALWLTLIAILIHYQIAGAEIFGTYFDYTNAAIYTVDFLILLISLIYFLLSFSIQSVILKALNSLLQAALVISCLIIITNLWLNAAFIENRLEDSPVLQVANLTPVSYCSHTYVFYKVDKSGDIQYLCPNKYGLLPGVGKLKSIPDFLSHQLSAEKLKKVLKKQKTDNQ